jgi:hypothetical protein
MKILRTKTFAEGSNAKKVRKVTDKVDTDSLLELTEL